MDHPHPDPSAAELAVVVAIVSDTVDRQGDLSPLARCLEALLRQQAAPPLDIVVPHHRRTAGIEALVRRFPQVRFLPTDDERARPAATGSREHHDVLRALGLGAARAPLVALLEDHGRPAVDWARQVVAAHGRFGAEVAAVGGAIENDIDTRLNWAVYFCDFARYQNPVPAGAAFTVSDANASFKRAWLDSIRRVWERQFHETAVNAALRASGATLHLSPTVVVHQHRLGIRATGALRERLIWGRSFAAARSRTLGPRRWLLAGSTPALPPVLLWRMTRTTLARRTHLAAFLRALPLTGLLTIAWCWGELLGYSTGRASGPAPGDA